MFASPLSGDGQTLTFACSLPPHRTYRVSTDGLSLTANLVVGQGDLEVILVNDNVVKLRVGDEMDILPETLRGYRNRGDEMTTFVMSTEHGATLELWLRAMFDPVTIQPDGRPIRKPPVAAVSLDKGHLSNARCLMQALWRLPQRMPDWAGGSRSPDPLSNSPVGVS